MRWDRQHRLTTGLALLLFLSPLVAFAEEENQGGVQYLPFRLRVCVVADDGFPVQQVNAGMKAVIDNYAKCGVAIDPHIFKINGGSGNANQTQERLRLSCDINRAFEERGSVIYFTNNRQLPSEMCEDPGATGCSTLCQRVSVSMVTPSGSIDALTVHESMHANCCGRPCLNEGDGAIRVGFGISQASVAPPTLWTENLASNAPASAQGQTIGEPACNSIRQGAAFNQVGDIAWQPGRNEYYKGNAKMRQLDGQTFFPQFQASYDLTPKAAINDPVPPRERSNFTETDASGKPSGVDQLLTSLTQDSNAVNPHKQAPGVVDASSLPASDVPGEGKMTLTNDENAEKGANDPSSRILTDTGTGDPAQVEAQASTSVSDGVGSSKLVNVDDAPKARGPASLSKGKNSPSKFTPSSMLKEAGKQTAMAGGPSMKGGRPGKRGGARTADGAKVVLRKRSDYFRQYSDILRTTRSNINDFSVDAEYDVSD